MPSLIHLIYTSIATQEFGSDHLAELLKRARANNQRLGLTGMLLHSEGTFFQVLEGEPATVDHLYETIRVDPRHSDLTMIIREPIARRSFGTWSMGFVVASREDLIEISGVNDFFREGSCLANLSVGRSQKLLNAFAKGRWRAKASGDRRLAA